jgi:hypothetical protein
MLRTKQKEAGEHGAAGDKLHGWKETPDYIIVQNA